MKKLLTILLAALLALLAVRFAYDRIVDHVMSNLTVTVENNEVLLDIDGNVYVHYVD